MDIWMEKKKLKEDFGLNQEDHGVDRQPPGATSKHTTCPKQSKSGTRDTRYIRGKDDASLACNEPGLNPGTPIWSLEYQQV